MSVATVQRGIRALERKLEIRLVEQDGRRVRLLPAGHVLVREADAVLRAQSDAVGAALADAGEPQRSCGSRTRTHPGRRFLPGVLAGLLAERLELRLRCTQSPATGVVETLLRGDADAAFSSVTPTESDLVVEPLFTESLLLAVPVGDALAGHERVSLREVGERPRRRGCRVRD